MPSNLNGNDESRNFLLEMRVTAAIGCILILLYSLCFWTSGQVLRILGVGVLVAGAALLSGFLLGFIFAIPRVGDQKGRAATAQSQGPQAPDSGAKHDSLPFNANLVEISDWLTKIIVGLGLVELKSAPAHLLKAATWIAQSFSSALAPGQPVVSFAGSVILYFSVVGLLAGYLLTILFLADFSFAASFFSSR